MGFAQNVDRDWVHATISSLYIAGSNDYLIAVYFSLDWSNNTPQLSRIKVCLCSSW
jgi:hypothetical protein